MMWQQADFFGSAGGEHCQSELVLYRNYVCRVAICVGREVECSQTGAGKKKRNEATSFCMSRRGLLDGCLCLWLHKAEHMAGRCILERVVTGNTPILSRWYVRRQSVG